MNFLKYSTVVLLLLAQETLAAQNEMCSMFCESVVGVIYAWNFQGQNVFRCNVATSGAKCVSTKTSVSGSFPAWASYASMAIYTVTCPAGGIIGLCTYDAENSYSLVASCPAGDEAAAFCLSDNMASRNLRHLSRESKKGEPVFQEGSQMEVEIDGVKMVIWDAKEQE
jgi:hypothetical protein